jgi:DNA modification methylase
MASIDTLKPDPRNARKRTERSATLIGESLKRYGAARSIVIDEDDRILAGNGTVEQARAAGITNVRIVETDGDEIIAVRRKGLTDQDKIGLAIADNRTSDLSQWDAEMLRQLDAEYDLTPWFFEDEIPVEEILPPAGLTDPDDVPDVPEEPVTKPGDLYILGNHRLLCGDSTDVKAVERLMDGQRAGLVLTDPPYMIGAVSVGNAKTKSGSWVDMMNSSAWFASWYKLCWDTVLLSQGFLATFGNWRTMPVLMKAGSDSNISMQSCIVWDKEWIGPAAETMFRPTYEICLVASKGGAPVVDRSASDIVRVKWHGAMMNTTGHAAEKPVELMEWFLEKLLPPSKVCVDLFAGSGTVMIAAQSKGRKCYSMEMSPAYCDVIVKRWENYTGNTALLHREDGA